MTRILTISFLLLISITARGQFLEFDELMSKEDIQALNIKTVHVYENSVTDTTLMQKMSYDKNGNLEGFSWYQVGYRDSITNLSTFKYDIDENETQSSHCIGLVTGFGSEESEQIETELICSNYKYTYKNGQITRLDGDSGAYITNGVHFKEYFHDTKGNLIKIISHDTLDNEIDSIVYSYDKNSRLLQCNSYENDGRLKYFEIYHYSENGQLKEVNCKNTGQDREVQTDYHYKYDENGKRTQWDRFGFWTNNPTSNHYEYDLTGKLIKLTVDDYVNVFEYEFY